MWFQVRKRNGSIFKTFENYITGNICETDLSYEKYLETTINIGGDT